MENKNNINRKYIDGILEDFNIIKNTFSDNSKLSHEEKYEILDKIIMKQTNSDYEKIKNGLIIHSDTLIEMLDTFIELNDIIRYNYTAWIMKKYYGEAPFNELTQTYLGFEDYRSLAKLKTIKENININNIPQIK